MATALGRTQTVDMAKLALQVQQLKDNAGNAVDVADLTQAGGTSGTIQAGKSGQAGKVDVYPSTASKGKTELTAADNSGNTTTTVTTAAQAAARTYTVPDAGADASFVMTAGAQTIGGVKTFSAMPVWPQATLAATGTNLATAAQLVAGFTSVTGADATVGVKLPATPAAGTVVIIKNVAAAVLNVYPDAAATINAIGSHAAIALAASVSAIFIADSTTQWYTIPLLPS